MFLIKDQSSQVLVELHKVPVVVTCKYQITISGVVSQALAFLKDLPRYFLNS